MKNHLLVVVGQSNIQGAARDVWGASKLYASSRYTGAKDPFPGSNNTGQGGSMLPYLIDLGWQRKIKYTVLNYAIGGASVFHYTGRVGASVSGGVASLPASQGYMDPVTLTGGSTVCVEGDSDFDPFSFLSRTRTAITGRGDLQTFDAVVAIWSNGESDAGVSQSNYANGLKSVANYLLRSRCTAVLLGLSSKHASGSTANYDTLELGRAQAVDDLWAEGKRVLDGASGYDKWGAYPPLYPEAGTTTYVHLTLRGQEQHAQIWNDALIKAGY